MWLVVQVSSDDGIVALVVPGHHDPILDPARLRHLVGVPQAGSLAGSGIMTVEDYLQTSMRGTLDDAIHQGQPLEAIEIRVEPVVDSLRLAGGIEELVGERQAKSVEAGLCHLVQHVLPVAYPEPLRGKGIALKPEPVDAREIDLTAGRGIDQFTMKGAEEAYAMTRFALSQDILGSRKRRIPVGR
jgi:hypothetical protein